MKLISIYKDMETNKQFTITKRIAKHGAQAVIVIPSILKDKINHGMLVKVTIDIIGENKFVEEEE